MEENLLFHLREPEYHWHKRTPRSPWRIVDVKTERPPRGVQGAA